MIAPQWQQRENCAASSAAACGGAPPTPALKPLPGDVPMRPGAGEIRHHRGMPVILRLAGDSRLRAHEGARAVGTDHQLRGEHAAVREQDAGLPFGDGQILDGRCGIGHQPMPAVEPAPQRLLQPRILDDPGELAHAAAVRVEFNQ